MRMHNADTEYTTETANTITIEYTTETEYNTQTIACHPRPMNHSISEPFKHTESPWRFRG